MRKNIIRILSWGGLGDVLLSTAAIRALKEQNSNCKLIVYYSTKQHREIYLNNPHIDELRSTSLYTRPLEYVRYCLGKIRFRHYNYGTLLPSLYYRKNAMDIIAEMLGVKLKHRQLQIFLTPAEDKQAKAILSAYKNPIILHTTPTFSKNKEWEHHNWEKLVEEMPDHTFIQLGLANEEKVKGAVDLRGTTTFRQATALVKHAMSFVGVDSGLAHSTNAFGIRGVVLFGPSNPHIWGHDNNINMYKPPRCSPCIDLLGGSKCPYGLLCMKAITVAEVKNALLEQLNTPGELLKIQNRKYELQFEGRAPV
ncbi:MAG TPA: glycosyltransferase family 9 protein [Chitinophagaceae bacterium]|nr:glycosyltransferase family 9 protein [Chitinophagaceae bacterium]